MALGPTGFGWGGGTRISGVRSNYVPSPNDRGYCKRYIQGHSAGVDGLAPRTRGKVKPKPYY